MTSGDSVGSEITARERHYAVQCYGSRGADPLVVGRALGVEVWNVDGCRFLDFTAQTAACAIGYGHPRMIAALRAQLETAVVSPNHIHPGRVELAERLVALTGGELGRCYFGVTGSDAIEAALKFARKGTGRWKVISHWNGYHGTTFGALSAHGIASARQPYEPLLPGFVHVPPPDAQHGDYPIELDVTPALLAQAALEHVRTTIEREGPEQIAAIIIEPIFAGGGVIVPPIDYFVGLRALCDQHGILLIFDEVVTGMGRTGTMFAYEHIGVVPDMLVLGKGLTSGYQALSAVLLKASADPFGPAGLDEPLHLHTMAGNPMGCAAALTTIDVLEEEDLIANARRLGVTLADRLRALRSRTSRVLGVRGRGLLVGIELAVDGEPPKQLERRAVAACQDRGLLVYGSSGPYPVLVLHPPLAITSDHIDEAVTLVENALVGLD